MIASLAAAALVVVLGARWRPRPARLDELVDDRSRAWAPNRRRRLDRRRRRGRHRPDVAPADIAEWCARLAAACRSGDTLGAAVRGVEPPETARADVEALILALRRGAALQDALLAIQPREHLDVAITVIAACGRTGASPAEPLDRAASALRARAAEAADRLTHSAQARLSAVVMTVLPIGMLTMLVATSPSVRDALTTPLGIASVAFGAALNLGGWRWMRRIIEASAR